MSLILSSCGGVNIRTEQGDLGFLRGQKLLNLEYDYSNMAVGKFTKEKDYVDKKVTEYNENEPGRGDKWRESWIGDRSGRFEPRFEETFVYYLEDAGVSARRNLNDAKYTMILKTIFTEPGYNIYITSEPASIDCEVLFVETNNKSKVLAKLFVSKCKGTGAGFKDFDTGERIKESYARCGKALAKFIFPFF
jgi:hypothetical protein